MRYLQVTKEYTYTYEEVVYKPLDDTENVVTEVLIRLDLDRLADGFSLDTLSGMITKATEKLSSFRIFNDPKGLTISGQF